MRFVKPYESKQHPPGTCLLTPDGTPVSKHSIRRVLAIVSRFYPLARPTRGMLKQVFNFFEPPHRLPMPTSTASAPAAVSATAAAAATAAVLFTGDATASAEGADRPKAVLHSDCMAADCTAIAGDRCLTHLTSDASMEADRKSATSMRCGAVRLISPFVAAAEDASQAAFAVPVCSGSDVPDRGTQSI